jgi:cell division protein FtsB
MNITGRIRGKRKAGTPFAFGLESEATPLSFLSSISDSEVFANTDLFAECLQMRAENAKLKAENESLKAKVVAMQATNSAEKFLKIREIPKDQAKEEIRAFFKKHDGEAIYPSDVMEALYLDYDLVYEICEELEKEGMVKGV